MRRPRPRRAPASTCSRTRRSSRSRGAPARGGGPAGATVAAGRGRAVISTLAAFGGSPAAVDNLRRLRAAGATVLYGTDLGNLDVAGPSEPEIALPARAG